MKNISFPNIDEYAVFYSTYLDKVNKDENLLDAYKRSCKHLISLYQSLSIENLNFQYAPGKWTLKDILQHLIDVEKVFVYRAMRYARKDQTSLPFFDEDQYAIIANAKKKSISRLIKEYKLQRASSIAFFDHLSKQELLHKGWASQAQTSVRACAWIIYAHECHHLEIIRSRYLPHL